MTREEFMRVVSKCEAKDPYSGRSVEMALFGNTRFFHAVTCYVDPGIKISMRNLIRYDKAVNGMSDQDIINKWKEYIHS